MLQLKKKREIHKRITAILFAVIVCITTIQFPEPLQAAEYDNTDGNSGKIDFGRPIRRLQP